MFDYHEEFITGISKIMLTPTARYPEGKNYFYIDTKDLDLIIRDGRHMGWYLKGTECGNVYPRCLISGKGYYFHQVIGRKYLGFVPECIDHYNGVTIDNTDRNLNVVTHTQNSRNIRCRGYKFSNVRCFTVYLKVNGVYEKSYGFKREDEAAYFRGYYERTFWTDYGYDFSADRRDELDLLELELSGKISSEEATYRHVINKAANNAWYLLRYNLFDYFREYNISEPKYSIDNIGRMVDINSGALLCPY